VDLGTFLLPTVSRDKKTRISPVFFTGLTSALTLSVDFRIKISRFIKQLTNAFLPHIQKALLLSNTAALFESNFKEINLNSAFIHSLLYISIKNWFVSGYFFSHFFFFKSKSLISITGFAFILRFLFNTVICTCQKAHR